MNPIQRMAAARAGEKPDRIPFAPTILEHAASVTGTSPSAAAQCEEKLADAHIEAWRRYGHDAILVGIDVYNAEAEALGCEVRYYKDNSVPGIVKRPGACMGPANYQKELETAIAGAMGRGRLPMLLRAAGRVKTEIGAEVPVGLGVSGPFSVCCELMGYEQFILACLGSPDESGKLLGAIASFLSDWCVQITGAGLGVTLFESWAAPPLLSAGLYRRVAMPWDRAVIQAVSACGGNAPTLVIGGDTSAMLGDIVSTGTGMLIADYSADIAMFLETARQRRLLLRGNIDPKLVASGPVSAILEQASRRIRLVGGYTGFVLGTGVLPYDTPAEHVLALRNHCARK